MLNSRLIIAVVLLVSLMFGYSCEKKDDDPDPENLHISGQVVDEINDPLDSVIITINDDKQTLTDSKGQFEISGLTGGTYILKALNTHADYSYSIFTDTVILSKNHMNDYTILLPRASILNTPLINTLDSIQLTWTKSTAGNFKEYRLYTGFYSEIEQTIRDETLLYTGNDISNTVFTVNNENYTKKIYPHRINTFRLYVYDSQGIITGSNILNVVTPGWDTTNFIIRYRLERDTILTEISELIGVDWDNEGNLWILFMENLEEWSARIVKYNYTDNIISDTIFLDEYGYNDYNIVTDDSLLWFQEAYNPGPLNGYNLETGLKTDSLFLYTDIRTVSDMTMLYDLFVFISEDHFYEIAGKEGEVIFSGESPFSVYGGACRDLGVAMGNNKLWILNSFYEMAVLNPEGTMISYLKTDLFRTSYGYTGRISKNSSNDRNLAAGSQMIPPPPDIGKIAIHDNKLAMITYFGIIIYTIVEY